MKMWKDACFSLFTDRPSEIETSKKPQNHGLSYDDTLKRQFFYNDLLIRNVIKFVPHEERQNIALSCKKLHHLSQTVPCVQGNYHLIIFCHTKYDICLKKADQFDQSFISVPGNKKNVNGDQLAYVMGNYRKLLQINLVKRLYLLGSATSQILFEVTRCFPFICELYTDYLSSEAINFLKADNQGFSKQITVLKPSCERSIGGADATLLFTNLKKLICNGNYFITVLKQLKFKLETVRVEGLDMLSSLNEIAPKCGELELDLKNDGFFVWQSLLNIHNITFLNISFNGFSTDHLHSFFKDFDIHRLRFATLKDVKYDGIILHHLEANDSSNLSELTLDNWTTEENMNEYENFLRSLERSNEKDWKLYYKTSPIACILPQSLKKLTILDCSLMKSDFDILPERCLNLERLTIKLTENQKNLTTCFYKNISNFSKLEKIVTNYLKPECIYQSWDFKTNVEITDF